MCLPVEALWIGPIGRAMKGHKMNSYGTHEVSYAALYYRSGTVHLLTVYLRGNSPCVRIHCALCDPIGALVLMSTVYRSIQQVTNTS